MTLIPKTYNHTANQIPNTKTLFNLNFIFLRSADIFAADEPVESFAADDVADHQNVAGCEARAESRYPCEHDAFDFWEDGCAAAG